jgi:hypothetical protein
MFLIFPQFNLSKFMLCMLTPTKGTVGVKGAAGDGRPIRVVANLLLVMITGLEKMRNCNYRDQKGIY